MGKIYKNGVPYGGGGSGSGGSSTSFSGSASDVTYNNTGTELESKNVQDALTEVAVKVVECGSLIEGMIVPVTTGGWVLDGTLYKYVISMESLTGDELLNVDLYIDGNTTDDQIYAFDMLVSYVESQKGQIVLYATEAINVDFSIIIRGNITVEDPQIVDFAAVKKEIEELKTQMETGRQYACVNEAVGESIHVEDTVSGNMMISDAGVNILPFDLEYIKSVNTNTDTNLGEWVDNVYTKDGISFTLNENGTITINGTNSSGTTAVFMSLLSNYVGFDGEYYCDIGLTSNKGVRLKIEDLQDKGLALYNVYTKSLVNLKSGAAYQFSIGIDSNATVDNVTIYPMLEKGNVAHSYVPYAGYDIVSCGKNLIDWSVQDLIYCGATIVDNVATFQGLTFTFNNDGSVTVNGTSTNTSDAYLIFCSSKYTNRPILKSGKQYAASCDGVVDGINFTGDIRNIETNAYVSTMYSTIWESDNKCTFKPVFNEDTEFYRFAFAIKVGGVFDNVTLYPQIEIGSKATDYEPYKESRVTINKDTQFPVTGLKSFDGVTNVLNSYNTEMTVQYALNKTGAALLDRKDEFWLTATITAGETEVTITNASIKEDTIFDMYCNNSDASGDITSVTAGSLTITLGSALDDDVVIKMKGVNL